MSNDEPANRRRRNELNSIGAISVLDVHGAALDPSLRARGAVAGAQRTLEILDQRGIVDRFLAGTASVKDGVADCEIVDIGYRKQRDLALVVPRCPW